MYTTKFIYEASDKLISIIFQKNNENKLSL